MKMTRKTVVSLLVALVAVVAMWLSASGRGLHVARTAKVSPVDCNTSDPIVACFDRQGGYLAEGLFIWDPH